MLEPGWRVEINLRARDWYREAARRLTRGFVILIDYGHPRPSSTPRRMPRRHADHLPAPHDRRRPEGAAASRGLRDPGEQDITAHVDFTTVGRRRRPRGWRRLGFMDQTYFLLGLLGPDGGRELSPAERRGRQDA